MKQGVGIDLDNDGMRVPQVTPTTKKTATRFGSQIRKLIMANHDPSATILGETGDVALDNYNKAISNVVSTTGESVIAKYKDIHGNVNMEKIKDIHDVKEVAEALWYTLQDFGIEADIQAADSWTKENYTDYSFIVPDEKSLQRIDMWLKEDFEKLVNEKIKVKSLP